MRIRGGHIAGLIVGAIAAFVVLVVLTQPKDSARPPDGTGTEQGLTRPPVLTSSHVDPEALSRAAADLQRATQGVGALPPEGVSDDYAAAIEVETTHLDVGVVPNDQITYHKLKVWNRGKVPLKISSIRTTCPCTEGLMPDGTVPPGGEGVIDIRVDPSRIGGFESTKTLTIFSNDPKRGMVEVDVTATVAPEFEVVPEVIDFGTVAKGESPSFTVLVRQLQEEPPLGITEFKPLDRLLAQQELDDLRLQLEVIPEQERVDPAKQEYGIRVTLSPLIPPGPFERSFSLVTNVPRMQSLLFKVDVRGEVQAPYTLSPVYPERLVVRVGDDAPAVLTVRGAPGVEIVEPEFDPALLSVSIREESEPDAAYLDVQTAPEAPSGRIEAELRFQVRVAGQSHPERVAVVRTFGGASVPARP